MTGEDRLPLPESLGAVTAAASFPLPPDAVVRLLAKALLGVHTGTACASRPFRPEQEVSKFG